MLHHGVTLTQTLKQAQMAHWCWIMVRRSPRLSSLIMRPSTECYCCKRLAALMMISCLVSAYKLSLHLLRPLPKFNKKSITTSTKFWDRTFCWSNQSFLSYSGTTWFLFHTLNISPVSLAEAKWVIWQSWAKENKGNSAQTEAFLRDNIHQTWLKGRLSFIQMIS